MQAYVRGLVSGKVDELGWNPGAGESDRTRQMRGLLLRTLGNLGQDADTIGEAMNVYTTGGTVDAEVAEAALMIVASNDDGGRLDELINKSNAATNPQQKIKFLRAATQLGSPESAEKLFRMCLDGTVRTQDTFWVLALLIGHRENGPLVWNLVTEHWDEVIDVIPPATKRRLIDLLPNRSEPEVAASIEAWFEDHEIPGGALAVRQQLELLKANVGLRGREGTSMGEALDELS
jgi:hypothetical protein